MQVYHNLLQQGRYLCSVSTMHRLLRKPNLQGDRRAERTTIESDAASTGNSAQSGWTWDIAKLPTRKRGEYLSL